MTLISTAILILIIGGLGWLIFRWFKLLHTYWSGMTNTDESEFEDPSTSPSDL